MFNVNQVKMQAKIFKTTILFSVFILLAQIFGLIRDLYLVKVFGIGPTLDIYYLALKVPDFLNIFYSVFLGSVIFIPLLTEAKHKNKNGEACENNEQEIIERVKETGSLVFFMMLFIFIFLFIFMGPIAKFLAPTFNSENLQTLISLAHLLLFAQFFFPIGILAGSIGMVYGKNLGMASAGFVYSFIILVGSILLVPNLGIYGVVISVIVGSFFFMLVQVCNRESMEILKHFRLEIKLQKWLQFVKNNSNRFFAVLLFQIYGVVIVSISSYAGVGSVSQFSIAYNLYLAAFFVIGASFGTALMTSFSKLHIVGAKSEQKQSLESSVILIFFITIPFSLLGILNVKELVQIVYYFSSLSTYSLTTISSLFAVLLFSLPFMNTSEVIRKYLYSTSQANLASLTTAQLLITILSGTYILNIFLHNILFSLVYAICFGVCTVFFSILLILNSKGQLSYLEIIKNIYKSFLIFIFILINFNYVFNYLQNIFHLQNFFAIFIFKIFLALLAYFSMLLILQDKVFLKLCKNIF